MLSISFSVSLFFLIVFTNQRTDLPIYRVTECWNIFPVFFFLFNISFNPPMSIRRTHMHFTITYCKSRSFVRILICRAWTLLHFDWLRPACPRPAGLIDMLFRYQRCKIKCWFKGMHHVVFVHCWSFYTKSIILFDILLVGPAEHLCTQRGSYIVGLLSCLFKRWSSFTDKYLYRMSHITRVVAP